MNKYLVGLGLLAFSGLAFAGALNMGSVNPLTLLTAVSPVAGLLGSKLFGKPSAGAAPKAAVMPTSDDKAVEEARRRQIAQIQARSGRASTILSGGGDKLGG